MDSRLNSVCSAPRFNASQCKALSKKLFSNIIEMYSHFDKNILKKQLTLKGSRLFPNPQLSCTDANSVLVSAEIVNFVCLSTCIDIYNEVTEESVSFWR